MIYAGKQVLVTGGLGFIGSSLAIRLVDLGAQVTLVDSELPDSGANRSNIRPVEGRVSVVSADISNRQVLEPLVAAADFVFNLAGTLSHTDSMSDPLRDLHNNCAAHIQLLETCRVTNPAARILYAGTRGQYGTPRYVPVDEAHPLDAMDANGINKTAGEAYHLLYCRHHGLFTCSLRLSNTYGPRHQMRHHRQGVLNWFVRKVLDGEPIVIFGDGTQIRDTSYIDDVVEAMLLALGEERARGQVYNLGAAPMSLNEVAELLVRLNGAGEIVHRPYPAESRSVEVGNYIADCRKIATELGWKPAVAPIQGFSQTLEYYREHRAAYW